MRANARGGGGVRQEQGHDIRASQSVLRFSPLTVDVRLPLQREDLAGFDGEAAVKEIATDSRREV